MLLKPKTLGVALFAALGLSACTDQEVSLSIVSMQTVDPESCAPMEESSSVRGVVDLALARQYTIYPKVESKMVDINTIGNFSGPDGRIDTKTVTLRQAVIEYQPLDQITANIRERVTVPISGTVPTGETAVVGVEVFNAAMIQQLRNAPEFLAFDSAAEVRPVRSSVQIIVNMKLKGETADGSDVETSDFEFPVEICNGCRVTYPPEAVDTKAAVQPNCLLYSTDLESPICPARVGVDEFFLDCRQCPGYAVDVIARELCQPPSAL